MPFTGFDGADLQAEGKFGVNGKDPVGKASAYTQTYETALRTVPLATQVTPPAGGGGLVGGCYDSAANRDAMIASVTAFKADLLALKKVVNSLIDDLQAVGLVG
jgi:hypothetical protein